MSGDDDDRDGADGPVATATLRLQLPSGPAEVTLSVPREALPLEALMPIFRRLAEVIVEASVEAVRADGKEISCRAGCGACCRQVVPISPAEARRLEGYVETLPEARRARIGRRYAEVEARLRAVGLWERLLAARTGDRADQRALGIDYFALGLACPFLEEESCSIYEERPTACREYLVTSPAAHCQHPNAEDVAMVPLPLRVSRALFRVGAAPADEGGDAPVGPRWLPLSVAPAWLQRHPEPPPARPGPAWVSEILRQLGGREE